MSRYVVSDLHGMYDLYKAIDETLEKDDIVYFLGDACDRGPNSWETLKDIILNPKWIFLRGNHEQMLLKALLEYKELDGAMMGSAQELCCYNGGTSTLNSILNNGNSAINWTIRQIREMPFYIQVENEQGFDIILSHSGFNINKSEKSFNPDDMKCLEEKYLWNRNHISNSWIENKETEKLILIHGHTPIPGHFITEQKFKKDPGASFYCNGHKINIDCGAVWTGITTLLDIDTFDETIFSI